MTKPCVKKCLVVGVILLFIGVAFAVPINANVSKSSLEPVPDLDCDGDLFWIDVEPGSTVIGSIWVENVGEEGSELNWEIESYPDWGIWTFDPESGTGLEYIQIVDVECVVPDEIEDDLWGEIFIVNLENSSDYCIIDVSLQVKSIDEATPIEFELQRIKELVQSIDLRKIIVNPDAVLVTLEEISTIIEENEDCGCEEDSSKLEGDFPIICILLFPLYIISWYAFWFGVFVIPIQMVMLLGYMLGCDWV